MQYTETNSSCVLFFYSCHHNALNNVPPAQQHDSWPRANLADTQSRETFAFFGHSNHSFALTYT